MDVLTAILNAVNFMIAYAVGRPEGLLAAQACGLSYPAMLAYASICTFAMSYGALTACEQVGTCSSRLDQWLQGRSAITQTVWVFARRVIYVASWPLRLLKRVCLYLMQMARSRWPEAMTSKPHWSWRLLLLYGVALVPMVGFGLTLAVVARWPLPQRATKYAAHIRSLHNVAPNALAFVLWVSLMSGQLPEAGLFQVILLVGLRVLLVGVLCWFVYSRRRRALARLARLRNALRRRLAWSHLGA